MTNMSFVSLLENPLKTILCEGTITFTNTNNVINRAQLETRLSLDYMNVLIGVWNVAVKDIYLVAQNRERVRLILNVGTNFLEGLRQNSYNLSEHCFPPLQRVSYDYSKEQLISFSPILWFTATGKSQNFHLIFEVWPKDNLPLNSTVTFSVTATILFQRRQ